MTRNVKWDTAKENFIMEMIYKTVMERDPSDHGDLWVNAKLFDGRTLRSMFVRGLIDYSENNTDVTLTEKGMGVLLFGEENAEEVLICV